MNDSIIKKLINDNNEVAVITSPGHGAGFSSWMSSDEPRESAIFDPVLATLVINGEDYADHLRTTYGGSTHLVDTLEVTWLPVGSRFLVDEYDGYESLSVVEETKWIVA